MVRKYNRPNAVTKVANNVDETARLLKEAQAIAAAKEAAAKEAAAKEAAAKEAAAKEAVAKEAEEAVAEEAVAEEAVAEEAVAEEAVAEEAVAAVETVSESEMLPSMQPMTLVESAKNEAQNALKEAQDKAIEAETALHRVAKKQEAKKINTESTVEKASDAEKAARESAFFATQNKEIKNQDVKNAEQAFANVKADIVKVKSDLKKLEADKKDADKSSSHLSVQKNALENKKTLAEAQLLKAQDFANDIEAKFNCLTGEIGSFTALEKISKGSSAVAQSVTIEELNDIIEQSKISNVPTTATELLKDYYSAKSDSCKTTVINGFNINKDKIVHQLNEYKAAHATLPEIEALYAPINAWPIMEGITSLFVGTRVVAPITVEVVKEAASNAIIEAANNLSEIEAKLELVQSQLREIDGIDAAIISKQVDLVDLKQVKKEAKAAIATAITEYNTAVTAEKTSVEGVKIAEDAFVKAQALAKKTMEAEDAKVAKAEAINVEAQGKLAAAAAEAQMVETKLQWLAHEIESFNCMKTLVTNGASIEECKKVANSMDIATLEAYESSLGVVMESSRLLHSISDTGNALVRASLLDGFKSQENRIQSDFYSYSKTNVTLPSMKALCEEMRGPLSWGEYVTETVVSISSLLGEYMSSAGSQVYSFMSEPWFSKAPVDSANVTQVAQSDQANVTVSNTEAESNVTFLTTDGHFMVFSTEAADNATVPTLDDTTERFRTMDVEAPCATHPVPAMELHADPAVHVPVGNLIDLD